MARNPEKMKKLSLDDYPDYKAAKARSDEMVPEQVEAKKELADIPAVRANDQDRISQYMESGVLTKQEASNQERREELRDRVNVIKQAQILQQHKVEAARIEASREICAGLLPEWKKMLKNEEELLFALHDAAIKRLEFRQELSDAGVIISLPDVLFPGINVVHNWNGRLDAHEVQKTRLGLGN